MFARLRQPSRSERIRNFFWPQIGWKRWFLYVRLRLIRMRGGPHRIAGGFAFGVAFTFTPLVGLHIILAAVLSRILGFNILAAVFGTLIGNPITLPFIWLWIFHLGNSIVNANNSIHVESLSQQGTMEAIATLLDNLTTIFFPMLVGGTILFPFTWLISYILLKKLLSRWQKNLAKKTLHR